jgi:hypothetical protein
MESSSNGATEVPLALFEIGIDHTHQGATFCTFLDHDA